MMFKKLHITGRNKHGVRLIAALLAALLLAGLPIFGASAAKPADLKDLKPGNWYYTEVAGAVELGLFQGISDSEFGVNMQMTRAQFVTALARLCGVPNPSDRVERFTDVPKGAWHSPYVSWAYNNGLVNGVSDTEFDPDRSVSRQEMCKMLGTAVEWLTGKPLSSANAKTFADEASIADWAKSWVAKCSANGLINGKDDNLFVPNGKATRAEAACVFYRHYVSQHPENLNCKLTVSGFALDFKFNTDYYLCTTKNFEQCKITGFSGFTAIDVQVEQYATYYPYEHTAYRLGDNLLLGHGRAKVTVTATLAGGIKKEYLIVITDPNADVNAYGMVKVNTDSYVNLRKAPSTSSDVLAKLQNKHSVYFLGYADGSKEWCRVQLVKSATVGYIHADYLQWGWKETEQPAQYKEAIDALQKAHPNWSFTYVDMELTYAEALEKEKGKYGDNHEAYLNPANYLTEDKIFAFLDIKTYDPTLWNDAMVKAIWANQSHITKDQALSHFKAASQSLLMNPVYIACRAALESGYGGSTFAKGTVAGYEGYYNFFGIRCYTANPTVGAAYAKERNWNSVFRSIVEGANWVKDQYLDRGAITSYFFRYNGFQNKIYMDDAEAPQKEASILKRAYTDPNAKAHFIVPVYRQLPTA